MIFFHLVKLVLTVRAALEKHIAEGIRRPVIGSSFLLVLFSFDESKESELAQ